MCESECAHLCLRRAAADRGEQHSVPCAHTPTFESSTNNEEPRLHGATQPGIVKIVATLLWRQHVAEQLHEAGDALAAGNARRASAALGTAVAYLEKARAGGDPAASALLLQLSVASKDESTERFSFAPGELEQLNARKNGG